FSRFLCQNEYQEHHVLFFLFFRKEHCKYLQETEWLYGSLPPIYPTCCKSVLKWLFPCKRDFQEWYVRLKLKEYAADAEVVIYTRHFVHHIYQIHVRECKLARHFD